MSDLIQFHWENKYFGNPPTHETGFMSVDEHRVPYLSLIRLLDPAEDGKISVQLEHVTTFDTTEAELRSWGWFLAQCMGRSAGFNGFPGTTRRDSYFGSRMHLITGADSGVRG